MDDERVTVEAEFTYEIVVHRRLYTIVAQGSELLAVKKQRRVEFERAKFYTRTEQNRCIHDFYTVSSRPGRERKRRAGQPDDRRTPARYE